MTRAETPRLICVIYFLLAVLLSTIQAKYQCPLKCDCIEDFSVVKCRDMENFPVFDFAKNVEILDLTNGKIKSIHEKQVKAYPKLEILFVKHNPLTCNENNLHVLRHALREELGVKVFDGYKVKCKGKMDMEDSRGKEPGNAIQLKIVPATRSYQAQCQVKGTCMSSGQVAGSFIITLIVLFCLGGFCLLITHYRHHLHRMLGKQAAKIRPVLQAEEGLGTRTGCAKTSDEGLKRHLRMPPGIPEKEIFTTDEEDVVDKEQYIKGKLKMQRRRSQGYSNGSASSSDDDTCVVEINLKPEKQPCNR